MITYFGYGVMRNPEVMTEVIGRRPVGTPATVQGMKLCIQRIAQVPEPAQSLLRKVWSEEFRSYVMVPGEDTSVEGMLWEITEAERVLVSDWELVHLGWFTVTDISATMPDGSVRTATTEILGEEQSYDTEVNGEEYSDFLNPKEDVLRVARTSREEFLAKG